MAWAPWRERGTVPAAVLPPDRGAFADRSMAARVVTGTAYFVVVGLWAAFVLLIALSPETLDSLWTWFRGLDRPYQAAGWVVLMPWTAGLAVWESSWEPAVRLGLVGVLALATILGFAPRPREDA